MQDPWGVLRDGNVADAEIEEVARELGRNGTIVRIIGYEIEKPERFFNLATVSDYVQWFTAAGSFKTKFAHVVALKRYVQELGTPPQVPIEEKRSDGSVERKELSGVHPFADPNENPDEDASEDKYKRSVNYCRHFGPYHKETIIGGEYVSFQLYGTLSGERCRSNLCVRRQGETLKARFGLYLCKDFIPFDHRNRLVATDDAYAHYHLLLNSQNFNLTADRNQISNEEDPKVQWVLEEAEKIIAQTIKPAAESGYFKMRQEEERVWQEKTRIKEVNERLQAFDGLPSLGIADLPVLKKPDNEAMVAALFAAVLAHPKLSQKVPDGLVMGHYSGRSATDMICVATALADHPKVLVELEYRLKSLFEHEHPFETFDYVVCWTVDVEPNERKTLPGNVTLTLKHEGGQWFLKYGGSKIIPVVCLEDIVQTPTGSVAEAAAAQPDVTPPAKRARKR